MTSGPKDRLKWPLTRETLFVCHCFLKQIFLSLSIVLLVSITPSFASIKGSIGKKEVGPSLYKFFNLLHIYNIRKGCRTDWFDWRVNQKMKLLELVLYLYICIVGLCGLHPNVIMIGNNVLLSTFEIVTSPWATSLQRYPAQKFYQSTPACLW